MFSELQFDVSKSILQKITDANFEKRNIQLFVKRDDLIHPLVSGNKWRKLKYNILQSQSLKSKGIITFGGAYSNHLVAAAAACNNFGIEAIGIVRGDELNENSNPTLKTCHDLGMKLIFVDRLEYNLKNDWEYHKELKLQYPNYYVVPEGGANFYGMIGCQEILKEIPFSPDHLFIAQGTCTTSCGLALAKSKDTKLHVVPVLKGFDSESEMLKLLNLATYEVEISKEILENVVFHPDVHFGGYAKYDKTLIDFIQTIYTNYQLPLDHVYTGKAFYSLWKVLASNIYDNSKVVFIHTGGLQGSNFWKG